MSCWGGGGGGGGGEERYLTVNKQGKVHFIDQATDKIMINGRVKKGTGSIMMRHKGT